MNNKKPGPLQPSETKTALLRTIRCIQLSVFASDYSLLQQKVEFPRKIKLIALAPFMNNNGIIAVGGRLENAYIDYDSKLPIVLSAKHPYTDVVVLYYHDIALHAGALATHDIRQKF